MIRLTDEGFTDDEEVATVFSGGGHIDTSVQLQVQSVDNFTMQEREGR